MARVLAFQFDVTCPFCKETVHTEYFDPREIDGDVTAGKLAALLQEGYELLEEDDVYGGDGGSLCEHVALFNVWGESGAEYPAAHRDLLAGLAPLLDDEAAPEPASILDLLMDADGDDELGELQDRMQAALPTHEVSLFKEFVHDGSGPTAEGGPTYVAVFLKPRAATLRG